MLETSSPGIPMQGSHRSSSIKGTEGFAPGLDVVREWGLFHETSWQSRELHISTRPELRIPCQPSPHSPLFISLPGPD